MSEWTIREKRMAAVFVVAVIVLAVAAVLVVSWRIRNIGTVRAIGLDVCWDKAGTSIVDTIDWGYISPGEVKGVTVFCKNTRNVNFTMSMNTSNWSPVIAGDYLLVSWNYSGAVVHPGEALPVMLQLYCDRSVTDVDAFSLDITIYAVQYVEGP